MQQFQMRFLSGCILSVAVTIGDAQLLAEDVGESVAAPSLEPLFQKLVPLFRKYYPKANPTFKNNRIHVEFNTRVYLIHGTDRRDSYFKDAHEEVGPQGPSRYAKHEHQGGVICDITAHKGRYGGQYGGVFPVESSRYYFTRLWSQSFSTSLGHSLRVELLFAKDIDPEFKRRFLGLIADFDKAIAPLDQSQQALSKR